MKRPPRLPLYPLLLAASPALSLYAQNTAQATAEDAALALAATALPVVAAWLLALAITRRPERAALIALLFAAAWLLFGAASDALAALLPRWIVPRDERRCLLPALAALMAAGGICIARTRRDPRGLTRFLGTTSIILTLAVLATLAWNGLTDGLLWAPPRAAAAETAPAAPEPGAGVAWETAAGTEALPDIYYIILDGYARQDILAQHYDYDNSAFIESLEGMGFIVARASRANYSQTLLSLASSLNMRHIPDMLAGDYAWGPARTRLMHAIDYGAVADILREEGYRFVTFETGYEGTAIRTADLHLETGAESAGSRPLTARALSWTPLAAFHDVGAYTYAVAHRERIETILSLLAERPDGAGPQFVLAHIVCPHPPFVFGPLGELRVPPLADTSDGSHLLTRGHLSAADYRRRYRDQLSYLNGRVLDMLRALLDGAERETVIILQADHGPGSMLDQASAERTHAGERMSILNAYRLPGLAGSPVYDTITPVNTFRVILNGYFGADYPLLPDVSYYAPWDAPLDLVDVTEQAVQEAGE